MKHDRKERKSSLSNFRIAHPSWIVSIGPPFAVNVTDAILLRSTHLDKVNIHTYEYTHIPELYSKRFVSTKCLHGLARLGQRFHSRPWCSAIATLKIPNGDGGEGNANHRDGPPVRESSVATRHDEVVPPGDGHVQ